jgi:CelD/BcsL family acetyltransferase involved in cellulose biosynthesis
LRIFIARTLQELDRLRPAWEHLQSQDGLTLFQDGLTLFQSFAWNRLSAEVFSQTEAPYVVYAESGGGAALIPAAICRGGSLIVFLGETLFDYRTVLAMGHQEPLEAAWREIGALRQQLWVMGLPEPWTRQWKHWSPQLFSEAPQVLAKDISGEGFASQHPRAARQLRRLERQGVQMKRYSGAASSLVGYVLEAKARQLWGEPNNLFADNRRIDFLKAALAQDPEFADIFTLEQGSGIVAAVITVRDGTTRRFYNTYHDDRWSKLSPGVALLYEATRLSLAEGLDCDYMTGAQPHKTRFATSSVPLYRIDATPEQVGARTERQQLLAA